VAEGEFAVVVRVAALGEQQPHLLTGHHIPNVEAVDAVQPAADPPARRLTTLCVGAAISVRPRCVASSAATWRICVIAVAGPQLVQAHRHTNQRRQPGRPGAHAPPHPVHRVCLVSLFEITALADENRDHQLECSARRTPTRGGPGPSATTANTESGGTFRHRCRYCQAGRGILDPPYQ
jgi:hypothetical protein